MNDSINILIIEDDEDINRLLCNIVSQNGYIPKPAYSGTEALIYLENQKWDMILLDLMLPGLSGEEILKNVRVESNVPVIIISAKLETQTKIEPLRAGADDYKWNGDDMLTFIVVPVVTFIIFGILGSLIFSKKEIK
jgi:DNA-binding response OmpR family regulator